MHTCPAKNHLLTIGAVISLLFLVVLAYDYVCLALAYESLTYFKSGVFGGDFWSFWATARLSLAGNAAGAYNPAILTEALASIAQINEGVFASALYYPPTWFFIITPFGLLPYIVAHWVFFFVTLGLLGYAVWLWTRDWRMILITFAYFEVYYNLLAGQNALLTAALFGFALYAIAHKRHWIAGGMLGLLTLKPQLGILIPFALLAGREWKTIGTTTAVFIALVILSSVIFGSLIWIYGLGGMLQASTVLGVQTKLLAVNPSLYAFVRLTHLDVWAQHALFGGAVTVAGAAMLLHFMLALPVAAAVIYLWRTTTNARLRTAGLACGAMLFSPFLYTYDMVWVIWPILLLGMEAARTRWSLAEKVILPLAFAWPLAFELRALLPAPWLVPPAFVLTLLLFCLVLIRVQRERNISPRRNEESQNKHAVP